MDDRDTDEDIELAPEDEGAADRADEKVKKLREEIAALRKEKQEYMDGWQRAKADYVNALRRFEEEKKHERSHGVVTAIEALLPAFGALERAKAHGEVPKGFAGIAKQLESAFAALKLEPVGETGDAFDPAMHEALGIDETDASEKDETVSAVLEKGWRMGEKLIRPAKVRIYRAG